MAYVGIALHTHTPLVHVSSKVGYVSDADERSTFVRVSGKRTVAKS